MNKNTVKQTTCVNQIPASLTRNDTFTTYFKLGNKQKDTWDLNRVQPQNALREKKKNTRTEINNKKDRIVKDTEQPQRSRTRDAWLNSHVENSVSAHLLQLQISVTTPL